MIAWRILYLTTVEIREVLFGDKNCELPRRKLKLTELRSRCRPDGHDVTDSRLNLVANCRRLDFSKHVHKFREGKRPAGLLPTAKAKSPSSCLAPRR